MDWRAFEFLQSDTPGAAAPTVVRPPEIGEVWHNGLFHLVGKDIQPKVEGVLRPRSPIGRGRDRAPGARVAAVRSPQAGDRGRAEQPRGASQQWRVHRGDERRQAQLERHRAHPRAERSVRWRGRWPRATVTATGNQPRPSSVVTNARGRVSWPIGWALSDPTMSGTVMGRGTPATSSPPTPLRTTTMSSPKQTQPASSAATASVDFPAPEPPRATTAPQGPATARRGARTGRDERAGG